MKTSNIITGSNFANKKEGEGPNTTKETSTNRTQTNKAKGDNHQNAEEKSSSNDNAGTSFQQEDPSALVVQTKQTKQNKPKIAIISSTMSSGIDDGDDDPYLLNKKDIWINILSFVGPGHFTFVAGVSKKLKEYYLEYFNTLKKQEIPKVTKFFTNVNSYGNYKEVTATCNNTFYTAAFSSVACAEYWNKDTKGCADRLPNSWICGKVAEYGNVEVLKWARYQRGFPWNTYTDYGCAAARGGRLDILQYLHKNDWRWGNFTLGAAVRRGHLGCIKYLHKHDCPWDKSYCATAAETGSLEILQYLHENACPWDQSTCSAAALNGNLKLLRYAYGNGCPWDERTCRNAAERGSLEILHYLHENGCPWDESTCCAAAQKGHFQVLKYARANGCPWDSDTTFYAEVYGYPEIFQWAKDNGCPL